MGAYAISRKLEETDEYVIYTCGNSPKQLYHKFMIEKEKFIFGSPIGDFIKPLSQNINILTVMRAYCKIKKYYQEYGTFPDEATHQS